MIIHLICAARPNFMKIAPLYHCLKAETWCTPKIVHTGQHYDYNMSQTFFDEFNLPTPDYFLNVGSGSHAFQTAQTMMSYETLCLDKEKPNLAIVVGDVNATLACAITAKKLHLPLAHLEAGLRSLDHSMPEEINRIATDAISDYLWTPSEDGDENLINEGISKQKISRVGNIMIDTYCMMREKIKCKDLYDNFQLKQNQYALLTLHRPANVDSINSLTTILNTIEKIEQTFIFPVHPRTENNLKQITKIPGNIKLIQPQSYTNFMSLVSNCAYIITDSGGIQEETTYLQIPCFTLRDSTERPITITTGSNQLVTVNNLIEKTKQPKKGSIPKLWDGKSAERIKNVIFNIMH